MRNDGGQFLEPIGWRPIARAAPGAEAAEAGEPLKSEPLSLLTTVSFPIAVGELVERSAQPITVVADALERLEAAGLIRLKEENGHQVAELTEQK